MSDAKYPPLAIETVAEGGEVRRTELRFGDLTYDKAFRYMRELDYWLSCAYQWRALLRNVMERDAESTATWVRQANKRAEVLRTVDSDR